MSTNENQADLQWPIPQFTFMLKMNGFEIAFSEVSGLDSEQQVIEYRSGDSKLMAPNEMPGLISVRNLTLKRGRVVGDDKLMAWFKEIEMNNIKREVATIKLLDEKGALKRKWKLENAWATKIDSPGLKASGNEVAIETLELAHEQLSIEN